MRDLERRVRDVTRLTLIQHPLNSHVDGLCSAMQMPMNHSTPSVPMMPTMPMLTNLCRTIQMPMNRTTPVGVPMMPTMSMLTNLSYSSKRPRTITQGSIAFSRPAKGSGPEEQDVTPQSAPESPQHSPNLEPPRKALKCRPTNEASFVLSTTSKTNHHLTYTSGSHSPSVLEASSLLVYLANSTSLRDVTCRDELTCSA